MKKVRRIFYAVYLGISLIGMFVGAYIAETYFGGWSSNQMFFGYVVGWAATLYSEAIADKYYRAL